MEPAVSFSGRSLFAFVFFLLLTTSVVSPLAAETLRGALGKGDTTLESGEYVDDYPLSGTTGSEVTVTLTSSQFDTYLIVTGPNEARWENDDATENESSRSSLSFTVPEDGDYVVHVTSYKAKEIGNYELAIEQVLPRSSVGNATGALEASDSTLVTGEYFDSYERPVSSGETLEVDLQSTAFDPYLIVRWPDKTEAQNDDHEGSSTQSHISAAAPVDGIAEILVTSYAAGSTGPYTLLINGQPASAAGRGSMPSASSATVQGTLADGDPTLAEGEYFDTYTFEGTTGQSVVIELFTTEFDPYLVLVMPDGGYEENDDAEGDANRSRIELTLPTDGEYTIWATSYGPAATGAYTLSYPTAPSAPRTQTVSGRLQAGDLTLKTGEFEDVYSFDGTAGDAVEIDLRSEEFDPYLLLIAPSGEQEDNDDHEGSSAHSRIVTTLAETGTYRIGVTSYKTGEEGAYTLSYPANGVAGNRFETNVERVVGELAADDHQLDGGEFLDRYEFEGHAGERLVIDLRSDSFDPYLIFQGPDGEQEDNDDHEGDQNWSQVVTTLAQDGTFVVGVTSYEKAKTGAYEVTITRHRGDEESQSRSQSINGDLVEGDSTLSEGGEYFDTIPISMVPGNHLRMNLSSAAFDTFLALRTPSGEVLQNDDCEGSTNESCIEHDATEEGEYTIIVTSYKSGESGDYTLDFTIDEVSAAAETNRQDTVRIDFDQPKQGELTENDPILETGEYRDIYFFDGTPGETVTVKLTSEAFDSYVGILTPSGETIENDDFEGNSKLSQVELPIVEEGRYRVVATSYAAGETGAYTLQLSRSTSTPTQSTFVDQLVNGTGETESRIFGIFMGIADYPGEVNDLPYTDRDAQTVFEAMRDGAGMRPSDGVVLTNSAATKQAFLEAIRRFGREADGNDTLIIFYSGHGAQFPRRDGYESADPDGKDEALILYDEPLLDNELNEILNTVNVGREFLVFDACFSGGFAKDVISRPGRMGLFSSEEDVTSAVAAKFAAGGYLSVFFSDTIIERYADSDENGELCALEISHYISERYRAQVKSTGYVSTSDNLGYQRLVVDRGSIGPYETVFRRK